jgi:AraC-like DNA-binding protein
MESPRIDPISDPASEGQCWRALPLHMDNIRSLPIREGKFVQLGRGDPGFRSIEAHSPSAALMRLRTRPSSIVTTVLHDGWLALQMPIAWRGDFRVNGQSAMPGRIHVLGGHNGFTSVGQDRDSMTLGLRAEALVRAIAALGGVNEEDVFLPQGAVDGPGETADHLRRSAHRVLHDHNIDGGAAGFSPIHPAEEGDLHAAAAGWLLGHAVRRSANVRRGADPLALVRKAEDAMRLPSGSELGLVDLCIAAGVGHSQLSAAFATVHGVSPIRYLRQWRLTLARERLLAIDAPTSQIKAIALDLGFMHSGRFASAYYATFGEHPSQTAGRAVLRRHRARSA